MVENIVLIDDKIKFVHNNESLDRLLIDDSILNLVLFSFHWYEGNKELNNQVFRIKNKNQSSFSGYEINLVDRFMLANSKLLYVLDGDMRNYSRKFEINTFPMVAPICNNEILESPVEIENNIKSLFEYHLEVRNRNFFD